MDRRNFFKTILATPLLTPLLLASKKNNADCELLLIADEPQQFISLILQEIKKYHSIPGNKFACLNNHPQKQELTRILQQKGWIHVQTSAQADLSLSFSHLHQKARPSFSLVKRGRIWDIRTQKLSSLWKEINKNLSPSNTLTIASFQRPGADQASGEFITIYQDGQSLTKLSLKQSTEKTFITGKGKITARINNGKAWITESACRHKICQYTPPISMPGERIICAPNHFFIEVGGASGPDTVIG